MSNPDGITNAAGSLFVADRLNNRIDVYGPSGEFQASYGLGVNADGEDICLAGETCKNGRAGFEAGAVGAPSGIDAISGDRLAVADDGNLRVDIFKLTGEFEEAFGGGVGPEGEGVCSTVCEPGNEGAAAGEFAETSTVTTDAAGDYFVGDPGSNRVDEFSPQGAFVEGFGEGVVDQAETFETCTTICVMGLERTGRGAVCNAWGLAFSPSGRLTVAEELGETTGRSRIENFAEVPVAEPPATTGGGTVETGDTETVVTVPGSGGSTGTTSTGPAPAVPPSSKFKLSVHYPKPGTAVLKLTATVAGRFVVTGKGVKKASAVAKAGRPTTLVVHAAGKAGAKVKVTISFRPNGGAPSIRKKTLDLKR
jgi:hypothetical protein